jgi:hypothetical protein
MSTFEERVNPVSGKEQTVGILVRYSYSVNGMEHRRTVEMSSLSADRFVPWSRAKVCYDADDLNTIDAGKLFPACYKCGDE